MKFNNYEIIEEHEIKELESVSVLLRHKKTGARVALLSNNDENKVFYIGFRTPPTDSTGVAHILEHSVLCGSKEFPVKDPFVELAKTSLNTFLNAMTYPDKTVYPVASCNDTDFQNLMHVYLDAVFYPNIYNQKKIFEQEGWHYAMDSADDSLKLNGVVYNEMKGAFSSPDDVHDRCVLNSLFPESPYGVESGGDPEVIPELTYEQFLDFHSKYYHPSNSYIYLYGNMDMEEKLAWIDENYLSKYDALEIDSSIAIQKSFDKPVEYNKVYSITDGEAEENATYLSYNTVVGDSLDPETYIAFQILDYALCSAPGAPLYEALLSEEIGREVYSLYDNGIAQPYFSIVAKQANKGDKDRFIQIIRSELEKIVAEGMNKKSLQAALNYFEFKYKEADFGSYPKGLMYGLQILDSWLYDDTKPFIHVEANKTFESLRKKYETNYFEELIEKYILNNNHVSIVVVSPEKGLTAKKDKELEEKLAKLKASLSAEEIQSIVDETKALDEYQQAEDSPEALECLPHLKRSDIKAEAPKFINELIEKNGVKLLYHDIFTNGIAYIRLLFDVKDVPERLVGALGLYKTIMGSVNTTNYTYGDLFNEINLSTGGMSSTMGVYVDNKDYKSAKCFFEVKIKVFNKNISRSFELLEDIIFNSIFEDKKRIKEIIGECKSHIQATFMSAGHSVALQRANSYFSTAAAIAEATSGIEFYRYVDDLDKNFDDRFDGLVADLKELCSYVFKSDNLFMDFTGEKNVCDEIIDKAAALKERLEKTFGANTPVFDEKSFSGVFSSKRKANLKNEGFTNSAQVQYVARSGNFREKGLEYDGALRVLKVMMGYDYLWTQVRVRGGAYGCMSGFNKSGDAYFVSYRDPNLEKTIEVYEAAAEYIRNIKLDEDTLTGFVVGAFSEIDMPLTPQIRGLRSLSAYMTNITDADIQRERNQALGVTTADINRMADYIEAFMDMGAICTVGNEGKIKAAGDKFKAVEALI